MHRPEAFNDERRQEYLERLREGQGLVQAARNVGVTPRCVADYVAEHPEFDDAIDAARQYAIDVIEYALFKKAVNGNVRAMIFYLTNRDPDRWRLPSKIQHHNPAPMRQWTLAEARAESHRAIDEVREKQKRDAAEAAQHQRTTSERDLTSDRAAQ
jgi:hypothetical protein